MEHVSCRAVKPRNRQGAFTVAELATVTFVISILALLILQGLSSYRERAKIVQCLANLRGMGHALQLYAAENNGRLPSLTENNSSIENPNGLDIRFALLPYDDAFWNMVCPADPRRKDDPTPENPTYLSYIYVLPVSIHVVNLSSSMCVIRDASYYHGTRGNWKASLLFGDGHCEVEKW